MSSRRSAAEAADRSVELRAAPAAARASGPAAFSIAGALEAIAHRIAAPMDSHAPPASVAGCLR
jgi:hypothetical protein